MATYLTLVNDVLARLREDAVATVSATQYSSLISKFVQDAKRQVEDAWQWDWLSTTIPVTTAGNTSTYTVTGSGRRHRAVDVNDSTNNARLHNVPIQWIIDQQQLSTVQTGQPCYYAWNGSDGTDSKVELYPPPDGIYTIQFNMMVPQADLSADADVMTVPAEPVVMLAYARALAERGEDGGLASSEAYSLGKSILADYIALEQQRTPDFDCFVAT